MLVPKPQFSQGFTLIELLVVISVIGLLMSVVLASVNVARQKSINTAILQEVQGRETALATLLLESGGLWPNPDGAGDTVKFYCYAGKDTACVFAGIPITGGSGLYDSNIALVSPSSESRLSQLAAAGAGNFYLNNFIAPASYPYGTVPIGDSSPNANSDLAYSVGIFYRCVSNDGESNSNCTSANIYWVQVGTTSCTKGQIYFAGNNNVICQEGADGGAPYPHSN